VGGSRARISSAATPAPRQRQPRIGPVPHQGLGPARLARGAISVKEPLNSNYISIWLWGVLRGPMLGGLGSGLRVSVDHTISHIPRFEGFCRSGRIYVRRGAGPDLAQVGLSGNERLRS
jgi:hypothetical protein